MTEFKFYPSCTFPGSWDHHHPLGSIPHPQPTPFPGVLRFHVRHIVSSATDNMAPRPGASSVGLYHGRAERTPARFKDYGGMAKTTLRECGGSTSKSRSIDFVHPNMSASVSLHKPIHHMQDAENHNHNVKNRYHNDNIASSKREHNMHLNLRGPDLPAILGSAKATQATTIHSSDALLGKHFNTIEEGSSVHEQRRIPRNLSTSWAMFLGLRHEFAPRKETNYPSALIGRPNPKSVMEYYPNPKYAIFQSRDIDETKTLFNKKDKFKSEGSD
ncbi:hypothetical protein B0H63DRAFT_520430 [Podospora didyma]|uniref:Uncharacterized protein n=1 Tax=Podospora didyma TaxID=330526 RepID=A0AAE0P0Q9_9PEZI|nr:hypothetical protein B0H63DRAFT_520430 [Podospora didyma]